MDNCHPIENLMSSTMENLKNMIDVNTIIGDAVETKDGSVIIPISKVSFGFASGGSEFSSKCESNMTNNKYPFGGGSGAGVSVKPVAFIVIKTDEVRLLPLDASNTTDKIIDTVPQVLDIIKGFFKDKSSCNKNKKQENTSQQKNASDTQNNPEEASNYGKVVVEEMDQ